MHPAALLLFLALIVIGLRVKRADDLEKARRLLIDVDEFEA